MNFLKKWWIFLLSIGIWISWFTYVKCIGDWGELDGTGFDLGKLGDSFGVINSLISAFTIVLVYKTFGLQKDELQKTTKTLEGQEKAIKEQRFQDNFFGLIELFNQHRRKDFFKQMNKDLIVRYSFEDILPKFLDGIIKGYIFYTSFPGSDINDDSLSKTMNFNDNETDIIAYYKNIMTREKQGKTIQNCIIQYMQLIIQLQKLIISSDIDNERKNDFKEIIQSILSKDEKRLIEIHKKSKVYPVM